MIDSLEFDVRPILNAALQMRDAGPKVAQAIVASMNRSGDLGLAVVRKNLIDKTGIAAADVTKALRKRNATKAVPRFVVDADAKASSLSAFGAVQTGAGVSAAPFNARRLYRGTFLATLNSGHVSVFRHNPEDHGRQYYTRKINSKGRVYYSETKGLLDLWGPNIAVEMLKAPTPKLFEATVVKDITPRLQHEIERVMSGLDPGRASARAQTPTPYREPASTL